jgi:cytochrome c
MEIDSETLERGLPMKKGLIVTGCLGLMLAGTQMFAQKKAGAGDAAKGKDVFEQCGVCHNADSTEDKVGPGLKGLFKRDKLKNGKKVTEQSVREMINMGGNGMPGFADQLSDEERNDVIAYLKTI